MEIITILALVLNLITLIIVIFQTAYTKKSLEVANNSIELTKTSKQLEKLPDMDYVIHVTNALERWNNELKEIIKNMEDNNVDEIIKISNGKTIDSNGLIEKWFFEKMPKWLSVIYASGAQYYYNSSCLYGCLKGTKMDIDRFKESSHSLDVLLKYISDEVPETFLNCPASLNTRDFFDK